MENPSVMDVVAVDIAIRFGWYAVAVLGGGLAAVLGVIIFGKGYKKRIAALEAQIADNECRPAERSTTIIVEPGGIYAETIHGGVTHVHLDGKGEIISSTPVRVRLGTVSMGALTGSVRARPTDATREDEQPQ